MAEFPFYALEVEFGTPAYDETIQLRDEILRKPLKLSFEIADIEQEYKEIHLACYAEGMDLQGCLVLRPLKNGVIKMRQVAVEKGRQRKGIGAYLVNCSEKLSKDRGFKKMELNARDKAIPFYEKLGYKKVGKKFTEVGIPHYKMEKKL